MKKIFPSLRMPMGLAKPAKYAKYAFSLFCLIYVFRGVPFSDLLRALSGYSVRPMFAVLTVSFAAYAMMGVRLSRMTDPAMSFRSTFAATLVGLAINNVLPAKAGEVAKALWMARSNGVPFQKTIGIVFMERFLDVNVLALLSLWFLWNIGVPAATGLFAACLILGWSVLFFFRRRPSLAESFAGLFGKGAPRRFVDQALAGVLDNMSPRNLVRLGAISLAIWSCYAVQTALAINIVADLGLSWSEALGVFAIGSLGMLLPSSPGALGVYEAFTVTALKSCGVEADLALAVALFAHMAQFIPVTLAGGLIFAAFPERRKNMNMKENIKI